MLLTKISAAAGASTGFVLLWGALFLHVGPLGFVLPLF